MIKGFNGKILKVNLAEKNYEIEKLPEDYIKKYLGARGLAARYYHDLINTDSVPLGKENKLIFMTGPLTGTRVPASTKFSCSTKSPETGHYLCSNSGGLFGPFLKKAGFDGIIFENVAESPVYLKINDDEITFHEAEDHWGEMVRTFESKVKENHSMSNPSVMAIGPAAENGVVFSSIQVDGRSFGRAGAGAVMASKKLKGIILKGTGDIPVAKPDILKEKFKHLSQEALESKKNMREYGTVQNVALINTAGCLPTKNFQSGVFEYADQIDADMMNANYFSRNKGCFSCPIACEQRCEVKTGKYKGTKVDPEFETVGLLGSNCGINDFATVLKANELCDEYSLDTMSTGGVIALAMELYERGILSKQDTGNIALEFGNGDALIETIHKIANREGIGALLGQGIKGIIKEIPESEKYAVHVKGLPIAAYDPRGLYGMSLTYGTSVRGACHNVGGYTVSTELGSDEYDRFTFKDKAQLVKDKQDVRAFLDSSGLCTQVRRVLGFTVDPVEVVLKDVTGYDFTSKLLEIGERIYNLERHIIVNEGVTKEDDSLPPRMEEPLPEGSAKGKAINRLEYEKALEEYYQVRGWDENGKPTESGLKKLKIK